MPPWHDHDPAAPPPAPKLVPQNPLSQSPRLHNGTWSSSNAFSLQCYFQVSSRLIFQYLSLHSSCLLPSHPLTTAPKVALLVYKYIFISYSDLRICLVHPYASILLFTSPHACFSLTFHHPLYCLSVCPPLTSIYSLPFRTNTNISHIHNTMTRDVANTRNASNVTQSVERKSDFDLPRVLRDASVTLSYLFDSSLQSLIEDSRYGRPGQALIL